MTPLLSEALQEAYASASTEDVIVDTLEVVAGTQHLYLCRGFVAITLNDENGDPHVFQPVPFEFNLPGQDSTGAQTLNVGIENVDGTVAAFVQSALLNNTPIVVKYRSYLPNRLVVPEFSGTATIFGTTYTTGVMLDGKEWLTEDLRVSDYGGKYWLDNAAYVNRGWYYTVAQRDAINAALTGGWRVPTRLGDWAGLKAALDPSMGGSMAYGYRTRDSRYQYASATIGLNLNYRSYWDGANWSGPTTKYADPDSPEALTRPNAELYYHASDGYAMAGLLWDGVLSQASVGDDAVMIRLVRDYTPPAPAPDLNPQNPRPLVLTITAAELTLKGVTFAASVADFVNQPFPNAFYSFTSFPGLR